MGLKELSFSQKLKFTNSYIFATFYILNSHNFIEFRIHSLKYQRCTTFDCKDSAVRKLEFVAKTSYLFSTVRSASELNKMVQVCLRSASCNCNSSYSLNLGIIICCENTRILVWILKSKLHLLFIPHSWKTYCE